MRIVIAGAGKMGMAVARLLCREGHDLTLIDQRQDKVDIAINSMDVIGCRGSCAAPETLSEAEAGLADLYIAATGADEANLIACQLARKMGAKHTIALLRNPEYIQSAELLKDTMHLSFSIHPDYVTAEEISRVLQFPAAIRVESFPDCEMEIVTFLSTSCTAGSDKKSWSAAWSAIIRSRSPAATSSCAPATGSP